MLNLVRALRDYRDEPLGEPVPWFTPRDVSQDYNTTPQPFLKYSNTNYRRIGVAALVTVRKFPRAVNEP